MTRAIVTLRSKADRDKVSRWAQGVPDLTRVVFIGPKRSVPQNDRYWACLTDISKQKQYHGLWLEPVDWSQLFMDALTRETRLVPNLDGTGFVNLRHSSSQLSHAEFADLLAYIEAWAAKEGVQFSGVEE